MFWVWLDGLDDQVELVGAVDLAGYAIIAVRRDLLRLGEVVEPIHPVRGVIFHDKHDAGAVFRARDQGEMMSDQLLLCRLPGTLPRWTNKELT